ncbi:tripartite tricarboxylate transporter TctB family protein [Evansella halocellulosilytica]|uniref:tripartite tricarboxylate transporter TctB family protein n=1 Tax=Evansella halocellulosilytica TaxID=2011013 RepID=UPI000BB7BC29|nr:tripartite tricarboxylate transporter TctB family protein [Evansella halocellulosilytica]
MTNLKWNANRTISVILFFFSIFYLFIAFTGIKEFRGSVAIDSDVFPKILGVFLFALSIFLFFEKREKPEGEESDEKNENAGLANKNEGNSTHWMYNPSAKIVVTVGAFLLYIFLFSRLGFVISTWLYLFLMPIYYGYKKIVVNLIVATVFSVGAYYAISEWLGINLPSGILSFF